MKKKAQEFPEKIYVSMGSDALGEYFSIKEKDAMADGETGAVYKLVGKFKMKVTRAATETE